MNEPKRYEIRTGVFRPQETDDLVPGIAEQIGMTLQWEYEGLVKEGPYKGQRRWWSSPPAGMRPGWSPECDIDFTDSVLIREGLGDDTDFVIRDSDGREMLAIDKAGTMKVKPRTVWRADPSSRVEPLRPGATRAFRASPVARILVDGEHVRVEPAHPNTVWRIVSTTDALLPNLLDPLGGKTEDTAETFVIELHPDGPTAEELREVAKCTENWGCPADTHLWGCRANH